MAVRVLRLLEYYYNSAERAEQDQARWQMPAIGTRSIGDMTIKSTVLTDLNFENENSNEESEKDNA